MTAPTDDDQTTPPIDTTAPDMPFELLLWDAVLLGQVSATSRGLRSICRPPALPTGTDRRKAA